MGIFGCSKDFVVVKFIFNTLQMNEPDLEVMNELTWDASICYNLSLLMAVSLKYV